MGLAIGCVTAAARSRAMRRCPRGAAMGRRYVAGWIIATARCAGRRRGRRFGRGWRCGRCRRFGGWPGRSWWRALLLRPVRSDRSVGFVAARCRRFLGMGRRWGCRSGRWMWIRGCGLRRMSGWTRRRLGGRSRMGFRSTPRAMAPGRHRSRRAELLACSAAGFGRVDSLARSVRDERLRAQCFMPTW